MKTRGPFAFTYSTYARPGHSRSWFGAAVNARNIARHKERRGDLPAESIVTEVATGRTWTIKADSDLLAVEKGTIR